MMIASYLAFFQSETNMFLQHVHVFAKLIKPQLKRALFEV